MTRLSSETKLYARRAKKDRTRVVCHVTDCGAPLGSIFADNTVYVNDGFTLGEDGIYALSHHARARVRRGRTPKNRRMAKQQWPDHTGYVSPLTPLTLTELPVRVRCSDCKCVQWINGSILGLMERPTPPSNRPHRLTVIHVTGSNRD